MPYLGDYLGQLMAEITIARMQADLETVRLAEMYAAHPLLRTMAVPRFRLPEIDLDLPVLIQQVDEPVEGRPARGGAILADMRHAFDAVLAVFLRSEGVALSATDRRRLKTVLDKRIETHGALTDSAIGVYQIADDLTADAVQFLEQRPRRRPTAEPGVGPHFAADFNKAVRLEFIKLRSPPPRLVALVTSAEIQAVDSPESVTRFRMKLTEQGVEWTTIESDGVPRDRLVPE